MGSPVLVVVCELRQRHASSMFLQRLGRVSTYVLRRLSWFLSQSALKLYYQSYIQPTFDHCDVVWVGCTAAEANLLQRLQNVCACTVLHQDIDSSASATREELQLSTLASRRKFHCAQHAFRAISGSHPPYLRKLFMECQATHGHRTRHAAKENFLN